MAERGGALVSCGSLPTGATVLIAPMEAGDVEHVARLAAEIWYEHYPSIISTGQIAYMLAQRYDPSVLRSELSRADVWWHKLMVDGELSGFSSCLIAGQSDTMKLDKLYVHSRWRRQGCGGRLIARVLEEARRQQCRKLELAVNKRNAAAIAAYHKHGFSIAAAVVKDIGAGFVMDDFVMEMPVTSG